MLISIINVEYQLAKLNRIKSEEFQGFGLGRLDEGSLLISKSGDWNRCLMFV